MAKTLVEQTSSLIQKTQFEALARRKAAGEELKALLLRNESPQQGDEERVAAVIQELGIKPADLPVILKLVTDMQWAEAVEKDSDEIGNDAYRKQHEFFQVDEWYKTEQERLTREYKEKRETASAAMNKAAGRERKLNVALQMKADLGEIWCTIRDGSVALKLSQSGVVDQVGAMQRLAELNQRFDKATASYRH